MVGEMRDAETAMIGIRAAMTGHTVLSTLHTNDATSAVTRLLDMGVEANLLSTTLRCVLAQRLIRIICPDCRHQVVLDPALAEESGLDYDEFKGAPFYEGKGCPECHDTGYRGRKCITEFLDLTDEIKEMILADRALSEIRYRAVTDGMITLRQSAVKKVLAGETTLREINRVTFSEER